jgi:hypothetical protein
VAEANRRAASQQGVAHQRGLSVNSAIYATLAITHGRDKVTLGPRAIRVRDSGRATRGTSLREYLAVVTRCGRPADALVVKKTANGLPRWIECLCAAAFNENKENAEPDDDASRANRNGRNA